MPNGVREFPIVGLTPGRQEEAREYPVLAIGSNLPNGDNMYAFESEGVFNQWIAGTEHAGRVRRLQRGVAAEKRKDSGHAAEIARTREINDRFADELNQLSHSTGLPMGSEELFQKALTEREARGEDPALIFQHINYDGKWLLLQGGMRNYPELEWNDIASSIMLAGSGILMEHINYSGRWLYLLGDHVIPDFRTSGWNDIISSSYML